MILFHSGLLLALGSAALAQEKMVLRVVADPWCPHSCSSNASKPGILIEALQLIFEGTKYRLEYSNESWARALTETREGRFHLLAGALVDDAPDFVFPKKSLSKQKSCFFANKGDPWRFKGTNSLEGRMLGAVKGYTYGSPFDSWAHTAKSITRIAGDETALRLIKMLQAKRIDTFIEDETVFNFEYTKAKEEQKTLNIQQRGCLKEAPLFVAVSPHPSVPKELPNLLNLGIAKLENSQKWKRIQASYGMSK